MSDNKVQWKTIIIAIFIFAAISSLLYGIYGTIWDGMYIFLFIVFLGSVVLLPIMIFASSMPDFIIDKLLFWIPKNKNIWNWFIFISFLIFICLSGMFGISIYQYSAESSVILIKNFSWLYISSLFASIFGIIMLLVSRITTNPKL